LLQIPGTKATGRRVMPDADEQSYIAVDAAEISELLTSAGGRAQAVLDATEEAAQAILQSVEARQEVEEEMVRATNASRAQLYRISKVMEDVLAEAGRLQQRTQELAETLKSANDSLANELGANGGPNDANRDGAGPSTDSPAARDSLAARRRRLGNAGGSEGARLLTLQLVYAGLDREAIEARLKEEFAIESPETIVEDVIGAQVPSH
jgi:hypothetical protein